MAKMPRPVNDAYFIDTWAWLVLANDRDPSFAQVAALRSDVSRPAWVTTDYVLDETFTRLFAGVPFSKARRFCEAIQEAAERGSLVIERITEKRFQAAWQLRLRYRDKPRISFTDLSSFVVMSEIGITTAVTGDAHFEHAGLGFRRIP
jgi:predicted nucleic acid-binding protein